MATATTKAQMPARRARGLAGGGLCLVLAPADGQFAIEIPPLTNINTIPRKISNRMRKST